MLIEIKHRNTGKVLHSYDCENNTTKITLLDEVKKGKNLSYSDLSYSSLRGSNLSDSDLRGSNLSDSDLRGSDLSYSNLSDSDLSGSNLRYSDLRGSDLRGSDLRGSNLPKTDVIINDRYHIHIRPEYIRIGCEKHPISWWKKLTYSQAEEIDAGVSDWMKQWKPVILAIWETIKDRKESR